MPVEQEPLLLLEHPPYKHNTPHAVIGCGRDELVDDLVAVPELRGDEKGTNDAGKRGGMCGGVVDVESSDNLEGLREESMCASYSTNNGKDAIQWVAGETVLWRIGKGMRGGWQGKWMRSGNSNVSEVTVN